MHWRCFTHGLLTSCRASRAGGAGHLGRRGTRPSGSVGPSPRTRSACHACTRIPPGACSFGTRRTTPAATRVESQTQTTPMQVRKQACRSHITHGHAYLDDGVAVLRLAAHDLRGEVLDAHELHDSLNQRAAAGLQPWRHRPNDHLRVVLLANEVMVQLAVACVYVDHVSLCSSQCIPRRHTRLNVAQTAPQPHVESMSTSSTQTQDDHSTQPTDSCLPMPNPAAPFLLPTITSTRVCCSCPRFVICRLGTHEARRRTALLPTAVHVWVDRVESLATTQCNAPL